MRLGSLFAGFSSVVAYLFAAAAGVILLSGCGSCESVVHQSSLPVLAAGTFDAVDADQSGHRLFFADQSLKGIDVVDVSGASPKFVKTVTLPNQPHGLAFDPATRRLYAGLTGGDIAVVDMDAGSTKFLKVVDSFPTGEASADLLEFSPETNVIYAGANTTLVSIDAGTGKVVNKFDLKSPIEQIRYDPADRMLYATTPKLDSILQLDPAYGTVTRTYTQKKCKPKGLAINPSRQLAMVACGSSMAVFNLTTGQDEVSRTVPGGDLVTYDAAVDRFTVGSAHGPRDSSVGVFTGDARFMGMVSSSPEAHGAVFDDATGVVYAVSKTGLLSFSPAACAPLPDWVTFLGGLSVFAMPLAVFGLFLVWYARRRSRIGPKAPKPVTREQLLREDFDAERERMRELEDAIYGPEDR